MTAVYKIYYPKADSYEKRRFYYVEDAIEFAAKEKEYMQNNPELFDEQEVHVVKLTRETVRIFS